MTVGFSVRKRQLSVGPDVVDAYRALPVANVSDCMSRVFGAGAQLRPMHDGTPMSGPAVTVRTRPGDNLMLHMALNMAAEGDVIVVDAGGDVSNALFGEMMLAVAAKKRLGGLVMYGAIRDSAAIKLQSLPIFAVGITHRGPYKDGPGEINSPISIGGMVVEPGDLIIGDEDGVLCVPIGDVDDVYQRAVKKHEAELAGAEKTKDGTNDRSNYERKLRDMGCSFE